MKKFQKDKAQPSKSMSILDFIMSKTWYLVKYIDQMPITIDVKIILSKNADINLMTIFCDNESHKSDYSDNLKNLLPFFFLCNNKQIDQPFPPTIYLKDIAKDSDTFGSDDYLFQRQK